MAIESAVDVDIAYKVETTFGVKPSAGSAQLIRRVRVSGGLAKETYQSAEVAAHLQVSDMRHGSRSVPLDFTCELSPLTYKDWMEATLRGTWAAGATFTSGAGSEITSNTTSFTRAGAGSWITDGFRVGDIVRWVNLADAGNLLKNFRITALTATVMTVAEAVIANATPDATATGTVTGKKLLIPNTRATIIKRSFTTDLHFSQTDFSRILKRLRFRRMSINPPPNALATVTFGFLRHDE